MEIALDITDCFNGVIDYVNMEVTPIIFLNFPSDIRGRYEFELMNFRLVLNDFICKQMNAYHPVFDDVVSSDFLFKSLFINGKARFQFSGVKGADIEFAMEEDFINGKKSYHSWDYKIEKGDYAYVCGGFASFTPWFSTIYLLVSEDNKVVVKFSSDDFIFIDDYDDRYAASKESKYFYSKSKGKLFDFRFMKEYFLAGQEKAIKDE